LGKPLADFQEGQFIGEQLIDSDRTHTNTIVAKEDTILLKFNKDEFYELISDQVKLADKILEFI
jgi:CRP-like cAMP-binding protein